jgi:hypothetical protein
MGLHALVARIWHLDSTGVLLLNRNSTSHQRSSKDKKYRPPLGFPQYWRDDPSGQLQIAVLAYLGYRGAEGPPPDASHIELLRDYLIHYIEAPCWASPPGVLENLISRAHDIQTPQDIADVEKRCLQIGLDPL